MKFVLICPPLGLTKQDFGVQFVYNTVSAHDFEYKIIVSTTKHTYKAGITFNIRENSFKTELLAGYGTNEFRINVGGYMDKDENGNLIFRANINNLKLNGKASNSDNILNGELR